MAVIRPPVVCQNAKHPSVIATRLEMNAATRTSLNLCARVVDELFRRGVGFDELCAQTGVSGQDELPGQSLRGTTFHSTTTTASHPDVVPSADATQIGGTGDVPDGDSGTQD